MHKKFASVLATVATLAPVMALAQSNGLIGIITLVRTALNMLVPMIITLALIYFFWGLAVYIKNSSDDTKRKAGLAIMWNGVLALFVMVSVWGLVNLLSDTFLQGVDKTRINVPQVPTN